MNVTTLDGGRLMVNSPFLPLLEKNGLTSFERIMACDSGRLRRDFPGRKTSRVELSLPGGAVQAVYLKRYLPEYLSVGRRVLRRMGWANCQDEAASEWEAIRQIQALGVRTAEPVAVGRDHSRPEAVTRSFLMTAEVLGSDEGHRFAARLADPERRELLRQIGGITGTLHRAGWVHKDLYLAHFLVRPGPAAGPPEAVLIDLQRATRPGCFRRRWVVKDLAALAYSTLKTGANESDIQAAFGDYFAVFPQSEGDARRLVQAVERRINWLKTRTPKHDTDFEQLR